MKKWVGHIAIRVLLLAIIIATTSIVYNKYFYEKDLQQHSPIINTIRNIPEKTDILYIGESSNIMYAETDKDKRRICQMLEDYYPSLTISDLSRRASHAGIFKHFLEAIPKEKKINTVVLTFNMRCFSSAWINSSLETLLQKNTVLLGKEPPILKRFYLSFKAYDSKAEDVRDHDMRNQWANECLTFPYPFPYKTTAEWDDAMAETGIKDENGKIDPVTDLACNYIKAFALNVDTLTNPRIKDFDDIILLAKERGWNLVFNFLGENIQKADELVGKDLTFLMQQNHDLLVDYYQRKDVVIIDNFDAIDDAYFIDKHWTTEHYTEEGRSTVAKNVALGLRRFFPKSYHQKSSNDK